MPDDDWWLRVGPASAYVHIAFDCFWGGTGTPALAVSGDSVLRLYGVRKASVDFAFGPAYTNAYASNSGLLALDEYGGLAVAPPKAGSIPWPASFSKRQWRLNSPEPVRVILVGVCPRA